MTNSIINNLLHNLWSKAVGTQDYDKPQWVELEARILGLKRAAELDERRKIVEWIGSDAGVDCMDNPAGLGGIMEGIEGGRHVESEGTWCTVTGPQDTATVTIEFANQDDAKRFMEITKEVKESSATRGDVLPDGHGTE